MTRRQRDSRILSVLCVIMVAVAVVALTVSN